jgi:hypothetical protein
MMTGRDPTGDRFRASGGDGAGDVEVKPHGGALATRRPREMANDLFGVVAYDSFSPTRGGGKSFSPGDSAPKNV